MSAENGLVELLDRLLAGGVVVHGDLTLAVADVDLVHLSLRTLLASAGVVLPPAPVREAHEVAPRRLDPPRINTDKEDVEKGLAGLVLVVVDILRQLMERQALRRIDAGGLTAAQTERLGQTFMALEQRMEQLREAFGFDEKETTWDRIATAS